MTQRQTAHAARVVARFRELLGNDLVAQLGEDHLAELELMVESAIGASVLDQMEHVADDLEKMSQQIRRHAENFED